MKLDRLFTSTLTFNSTTPYHQTTWQVIQSYIQLTKPRIILLLLITMAASMEMAAKGHVDPWFLLIALVSGTCAAGAANTINCLYDRDIDFAMERTRHRPLPSGRIQPHDALLFAIALTLISFTLLAVFANLLSASLAMVGILVYVLVYTHWLKRHHSQNIVIGGVAGAIPPLVGWAAVTGDLSWAAWCLFVIVFLWTPPHFWALAMMIQDDYAKVNVPMLPVVAGNETTARQIFAYTLILIPVTLLLGYPLDVMNLLYPLIALVLGGIFVHKAWLLMQSPSNLELARSLFKYSIVYMMLLSIGIVIDCLPITYSALNRISGIINLLN
ncbi:heme o synthase [Brasilonema octagenarum]|uniref:Protoheme IX farnesyltransferase n=1 Tax=Brasilonema octagenarum UFV-OR1 TaxID=417115 RepID=A0ABX1M6V2_9CYAN|nr:heme o synthase [Brasilonema octagenarum]NMF64280.1 protoheme IX farnesyltransferase [Brasilonema octagenarum UFV-OR1]